MMHLQKVKKFIAEALECSVFIRPREPGLTFAEIKEIGDRRGYREGEIGDAFVTMGLHSMGRGSKLLGPEQQTLITWKFFLPETPEYRDLDAFDFVYTEFGELARNLGQAKAQMERDTLVSRALSRGISETGIEVAITILIFAEYMAEKDGVLRFAMPVNGNGPLPSEQMKAQRVAMPRDTRSQLMPIVKDVISRRTDGRPRHAEPFDAFAARLSSLGYAGFHTWWVQIVSELRRSDVQSASVSVCVLAAALVEGALTFVVKHARSKQVGPFGSNNFERDPRTWRIDELVSSAASGGRSSILDQATRSRADSLIQTRQRIHAGRMLSDHPAGVPDLRPEEARDAKQTAELVVRNVLDWLDRFPPNPK
ncbi:hypothetical protein [Bradyrhizobium sp. CCBAU 21360]|uniref:hypothetical protein n=1 Tax=Bradyrhizobium sp. CCBAU 21360 TaxID=1325081 RepID=UPI0023052B6D|nr:hypothetical protein [Bradyrhizobium sp. CCBAU 21360]MDA9448259.1 hypothetical protein [Bradyrhizobium sp. CCBAU 21360]